MASVAPMLLEVVLGNLETTRIAEDGHRLLGSGNVEELDPEHR